MNFFSSVLRVAAALLLSAVALQSNAAPVSYAFSASISNMWEYDAADGSFVYLSSSSFPGAIVELNDVFTGVFAIDPNTALSSYVPPQPVTGQYKRYDSDPLGGMTSFSNSRGDITYLSNSIAMGTIISVMNEDNFGQDYLALDNSAAFGAELFQLSNFFFIDRSGGVFSDASLPGSMNLSAFDEAMFGASWVRLSDGDQFHMSGTIATLERVGAREVPEPLSLALFALAAVAAFSVRKMRAA